MIFTYELEVRWLESRLRARAEKGPCTVFYGSSSIRLWPSLETDFPGVPIVNQGFGGSTLEACAHFFERLVPPANPRAILLYAGDNDLGDAHMPDRVLASYRALMAKADALLPGVPVCFLAIKPSPLRWGIIDRIRECNALIEREARERGPGAFLDVFPAMLGGDGLPRQELYETDDLHLSPAGYQLWADFLRTSPAAHILFS